MRKIEREIEGKMNIGLEKERGRGREIEEW